MARNTFICSPIGMAIVAVGIAIAGIAYGEHPVLDPNRTPRFEFDSAVCTKIPGFFETRIQGSVPGCTPEGLHNIRGITHFFTNLDCSFDLSFLRGGVLSAFDIL